MKKIFLGTLFAITLLVALSLMFVGGIMDMSKTDRVLFVSKEHAWFDGLFVLGISIIFLILALH
jgi:hypothetical protein